MEDIVTEQQKHRTIFAAIAKAVGEVKQLGKSERNKFDGYDFVSIDKFLSLVNPICAAHGLFPSINLTATEMYENTNSKGTKSTWARFSYDIALHHETGETFGPVNTMVAVPMNGAQASGSAQSYALKQFFRGMFMIPTGDKDDPDLNATEQHHNAEAKSPPPPRDAPAPAPPPQEAIEAAINSLSAALDLDMLAEIWRGLPVDVKRVTNVLDAKDKRKAELQSADIGDAEIPY